VELDLRSLFRIGRRWWWLLVLAPLVSGLTAYWASSRQQPLYSATSTLMIQPPQGTSTDSFTALRTGQSLATTYQQLVATEPVLQPVIAQLALPFTFDELADRVSASTVRDTQLLRISASDTDPARAADLANAVANQFAAFISDQLAAGADVSRAALSQLVNNTQHQIDETERQIRDLEASGATDSDTQNELDTLRARQTQLESSYANLIVQQQQMEFDIAASKGQIGVSVPARIPSAPYAPRTTFYVALALFVGLLIAVGGIALLEYLDNTVKATSDFGELVGAPLLSTVGFVPRMKPGTEQLFVLRNPRSASAEAVRLLRTNVEFAAASREIASLAVTSPGPAEGKSTVTANLAIAMAQAGFSTVVVDADLRRPSQHKLFEVQNQRGLTTLLTHPDHPWKWASIEVLAGKLFLIPSGPLPPNPADLLASDRMRDLITDLTQTVDLVLIDTPPILAATDPLVVAPNVSGVVLICRANRTRRDALRRAAQALQQGGIRIIGTVLNQNSAREGSYYYYEGYYGPRGPATPQATEAAATPSKMRRKAADTG
jgi:capsular exopolysaccharide synthesis family protein